MSDNSLSIPPFLATTKERNPLGEVLLDMQRAFPEFNFYHDKPDNMSTNHYLLERKPVPFQLYFEYGQVKRWFLNVISHAQQKAREGDIEEAIHWYQTLIDHRYPNYKPYDLLNGIYKKEKAFEAQRRHLSYSIEFFTDLRQKQKDYVLSLAHKYNCEYKALEYINRNDKIHYYGGAFVLYDPVKVLEKWESIT